MKGLLTSDGKTSSMRFSFILISIGIFVLMISVAFYIIISALKSEPVEPSWEAIGVFVAGIALPVIGAGYNKVQQKKVETNESQTTS